MCLALHNNILNITQVEHPMLKLKSLCVQLLEVMLEETDEKSEQLAHWILPHFNLSVLFNAMLELWMAYNSTKSQHAETAADLYCQSVLRAYHILLRLSDYQHIAIDEFGKI